MAAILGIINACKMQKIISKDRMERRKVKLSLNKLMNNDNLAIGIKEMQDAISAAIVSSNAAATGSY